jgi:glyoxylase-like metal-dependent hydrolase (beta-lactamase superfamily II)
MAGEMRLKIWDVEHGACAMLDHVLNGQASRLAMIDCGCREDWHPSAYLRQMNRTTLDYLIITNADQDHLSDLAGFAASGITVATLTRNPQPPAETLRAIKAQGGPLTNDMERGTPPITRGLRVVNTHYVCVEPLNQASDRRRSTGRVGIKRITPPLP